MKNYNLIEEKSIEIRKKILGSEYANSEYIVWKTNDPDLFLTNLNNFFKTGANDPILTTRILFVSLELGQFEKISRLSLSSKKYMDDMISKMSKITNRIKNRNMKLSEKS